MARKEHREEMQPTTSIGNRKHNKPTCKGRREAKVNSIRRVGHLETNTKIPNKAWQSLVEKKYIFVLLTPGLNLC